MDAQERLPRPLSERSTNNVPQFREQLHAKNKYTKNDHDIIKTLKDDQENSVDDVSVEDEWDIDFQEEVMILTSSLESLTISPRENEYVTNEMEENNFSQPHGKPLEEFQEMRPPESGGMGLSEFASEAVEWIADKAEIWNINTPPRFDWLNEAHTTPAKEEQRFETPESVRKVRMILTNARERIHQSYKLLEQNRKETNFIGRRRLEGSKFDVSDRLDSSASTNTTVMDASKFADNPRSQSTLINLLSSSNVDSPSPIQPLIVPLEIELQHPSANVDHNLLDDFDNTSCEDSSSDEEIRPNSAQGGANLRDDFQQSLVEHPQSESNEIISWC